MEVVDTQENDSDHNTALGEEAPEVLVEAFGRLEVVDIVSNLLVKGEVDKIGVHILAEYAQDKNAEILEDGRGKSGADLVDLQEMVHMFGL